MQVSDTPGSEQVMRALRNVSVPGGGDLVGRDLVRALVIDEGNVRFVIEAGTPELACVLEPVRERAEVAVRALPGVQRVSVSLSAPAARPRPLAPRPAGAAGAKPGTRTGDGPGTVPGVRRIIAIGSGKGGVGKSTVAANLAVALVREGWRVGLVDADIHGPSQPRMMGVSGRPEAADGTAIIPPVAHGVTMISIGLLLHEGDEAVTWRGPALVAALQELFAQVQWGDLDVLLVDMPPGTSDVQQALCQRFRLAGAIVVSTPQDVALLDARKALKAFQSLKAPVLGVIENMSTFICPQCGHEEHIFGDGGMQREAERLGLPFLGALPLSVETRLAGDGGVPVAATDSKVAGAYRRMARRLIERSG